MLSYHDEVDKASSVYNDARKKLQCFKDITAESLQVRKEETTSRLQNLLKMSENEVIINKDNGIMNISISGSNNSLVVVDSKGAKKPLSNTYVTPPGMEQEVLRRATFKTWPHSAPVSAGALARAGFFYKGSEDKVECFACRGQIREWEYGDSAFGEHKKHFPKCPFVRDIHYKNVPIDASNPLSGTTEQRSQEKAAGLFNAGQSETKKNQTGKKASGKPSKADGFEENKKTHQGKPTRQPTMDSAEHETKLTFRSEYKRLLSFQNWPRDSPVVPRDLAKAGFYSLEKEDVVQCFACFGKINRWEQGDDAQKEHEKHYPSCPFVLGFDVKNEPISDLQRIQAESMNYRFPSEFEPALQRFAKHMEPALPQTAKVRSKWVEGASAKEPVVPQPKFPLYTGENKRLSTFDVGWPGVIGITPHNLARAGFFYTGEGDSTKCFYCGGGLKNWESTDEPWTEHAKWFPACAWLVQQRGQTFVTYVVRNFPVDFALVQRTLANKERQEARSTPKPKTPAPPTAAAARHFSSSASAHQEPEEEAGVRFKQPRVNKPSIKKQSPLDTAMSGRVTTRVLEMGYDPHFVKKVVRHRLQTLGVEFDTTNDLLEAVWQAEESGMTLPSSDDEEPAGGTAEKFMSEMPEKKRQSGHREEELERLSEQMEEIQIGAGPTGASPENRGRTNRVLERQMSPTHIEEEIERLRDEKLCKVCMDEDANMILMPCNHFVLCSSCTKLLNDCPICRTPIREVIRVYKS
ncbi:E3 ubiquitin-protein ligase XIAP-like [Asterias amurensis]|uniref:E3 ubiquitin-protein ligase XIAP-like n=1 Tax=Asterias amurensis TaxID=7602 RepID=UPI003AB3D70A